MAEPLSHEYIAIESPQARTELEQPFLSLDHEFQLLMNSKSLGGRLLYAFIQRTLNSFHLNNSYNIAFVLNEAYIRAWSQIQRGVQIKDLSAWLRATSYNIIRELSRDQRRLVSFDDHEHEHAVEAQQPVLVESLEDEIKTLRFAFQMLDPMDQKLLNLKIVQGLSWREIREDLRFNGYGDHSEAVLRKRKERAMTRLRKKFHLTDFHSNPEFPQKGS